MRRRRLLVAEFLEQRSLLSTLSYSLTTDRSVYQVGQPIQVTFSETNSGTQAVSVQVIPTDFTVSVDGKSIWQSNPGNASQLPTTETLQPGQTVSQTATWNGKTSYSALPNSSAISQINNFGTFSVSNPNGPQGTSATFQITSPISSSLTTNKQIYQLGEPIQATFTQVNTASLPIVVLSSPPEAFDVYQNGKPLWVNNYPQVVVIKPIVLSPGQTITDTQTLTAIPNAPSIALQGLTGSFDATYGPQTDPTEYSTPFQITATANNPPPTMPPTLPPTTLPPTPVPPITLPPTSAPPIGLLPPPTSSPITATLLPNHSAYKSGQAIRFTMSLTNTTSARVMVAPKPGVDGITVMNGSTVVYRSGGVAWNVAAGSIKPHGSLKLVLNWSGRPNQSGIKKLTPGTYTVQVVEGGYLATATIRIVGLG